MLWSAAVGEVSSPNNNAGELEAAPVLQNDRMYVPVSFFSQVLDIAHNIADGVITFSYE
jgi:hypothetical protein